MSQGITQYYLTTAAIAGIKWIWRMKMNIDWNKIQLAVDMIKLGVCNKCIVDGGIVYKCGTIVRIDLKGVFTNDTQKID